MSGIGRGGTGVLKVDGKEVARQTMERTIDRPKLTPEDEKRLMQAQRNNKVSE
jgi:hypothetical protein